MKQKMKVISLIMVSLCMVFSISCDVDVPITEMVKAKSSIKRAQEVMADKYDPDNLNKAIENLYKCHELVKSGDIKKAKEAAVTSFNHAKAAIVNSLPKLAGDTLSEAMSLYQEAENLNAENFAPEQFTAAEKQINEADRLKTEEKFWESYLQSKDAIASGTEAKNISMEKIPSFREDLNNMKNEITDLKTKKLSDESKEDINAAEGSLIKAEDALSANNIKTAAAEMSDANASLQRVRIEVQKISAKEKIEMLRKEANTLQKKRGTEFASEDIEIVISTLNEAESLLEQDKTEESMMKISDAENSLAIAKEKTTRGLALSKAESVDKLIKDTKKRDTKNSFQEEIEQAEGIYSNGMELLDKKSYAESLEEFNKAESLLLSLSVAEEKDYFKNKELHDQLEYDKATGQKIYTVKLNKKQRDCLWRIAGKIYRNARLWPLIYMANRDKIKDPDLIFPGQRFLIPDVPEKKEIKNKDTDDIKGESSEKRDEKNSEPEAEE